MKKTINDVIYCIQKFSKGKLKVDHLNLRAPYAEDNYQECVRHFCDHLMTLAQPYLKDPLLLGRNIQKPAISRIGGEVDNFN